MFKVGEKVVFIGSEKILKAINGMGEFKGNQPKKHEIVTISYITSDGYICLKEYEKDFDGQGQCFANKFFRKLDTDFATDVIAEIIKQVKEESLTLAN